MNPRDLPPHTAAGILALAVCIGGATLAFAGALGWGT